jgi:hypothetical protein
MSWPDSATWRWHPTCLTVKALRTSRALSGWRGMLRSAREQGTTPSLPHFNACRPTPAPYARLSPNPTHPRGLQLGHAGHRGRGRVAEGAAVGGHGPRVCGGLLRGRRCGAAVGGPASLDRKRAGGGGVLRAATGAAAELARARAGHLRRAGQPVSRRTGANGLLLTPLTVSPQRKEARPLSHALTSD